MWLIRLARLRIRSQPRVFLFYCWPRERFKRILERVDGFINAFIQRKCKGREACTTSSYRQGLPAYEDKQQRRLCWLWCCNRYPRRCMQFKAVWRFDSIQLWKVTKVSKTKYLKASTYFQLSQEASFYLFISPWFWWGFKTWFWFSP